MGGWKHGFIHMHAHLCLVAPGLKPSKRRPDAKVDLLAGIHRVDLLHVEPAMSERGEERSDEQGWCERREEEIC